MHKLFWTFISFRNTINTLIQNTYDDDEDDALKFNEVP